MLGEGLRKLVTVVSLTAEYDNTWDRPQRSIVKTPRTQPSYNSFEIVNVPVSKKQTNKNSLYILPKNKNFEALQKI